MIIAYFIMSFNHRQRKVPSNAGDRTEGVRNDDKYRSILVHGQIR